MIRTEPHCPISKFRGSSQKSPDAQSAARRFNGVMPIPRMHIVDSENAGTYHLISRCVRRARLAGRDPVTGLDYSHRRTWLEKRIRYLAEHFSIAVYAYSIMENHLHLVVRTDPAATLQWDAQTVLRRWCAVKRRKFESPRDFEAWLSVAACDEALVAKLRSRLGSLSWFMSVLKEPIARLANAEDGCTGHFWEARFHCKALLDEAAVLSGMAYVDLNPLRAGIVNVPEAATHVSIAERWKNRVGNEGPAPALLPIAGHGPERMISVDEYFQLVDAVGRTHRSEGAATIKRSAPPVLQRLGLSQAAWAAQVSCTESRFWRVIGNAESFARKTVSLGRLWLKGKRFASLLQTL